MRILAIETSCDETAVSIVQDGTHALSSVIASAQGVFTNDGGVIPEEAARKQVECMLPVLHRALLDAKSSPETIDAVAVTRGPGLLGSLLVGTTTGRTIAALWKKPLIGVHHTLGHLTSTWLRSTPEGESPVFPIITLSASGGHTDLGYRTAHMRGMLLGRTRDDAAGEAFDKGASLLGLPYPGGPAISKAAEGGRIDAFPFPLPLHNDGTLDFSFSGLKTALRYTLRDHPHAGVGPDLPASYQHALCRHLTDRLQNALTQYPATKEVHLVGGVSANTYLRELAREACGKRILRTPEKISYCTDNAAMIGAAAFFLLQENSDAAYAPFETLASIPLKDVIHAS